MKTVFESDEIITYLSKRKSSSMSRTMSSPRAHLTSLKLKSSIFYFVLCISLFVAMAGAATTINVKTVAPTSAPTIKVTSRQKNVIRIGAAIPMMTALTGDIDGSGIQKIAAFLVAIQDMKQELQPLNYTVKFALRDSKSTFSNAVVAALDLVGKVFNGTGVHGIIGAGSNTVTLAMTYVTQDYDVGEMAYSADSSDLSHQLNYPDFMRVYPSSSLQAVALAQLVANTFNWRRVVVAYTADSYGIDAYAEFQLQALKLQIFVVYTIAVTPGLIEDFSSQIETIKKYDGRIFVFLMSDVSYANNLLKQGAASDVFNDKSVVLGTSVMSTQAMWQTLYSIFSSNTSISNSQNTQSEEIVRIRKFMDGFIGLRLADNDWKVTPEGKTYIEKFRALPPSISYNKKGKAVCSMAKDDDGNFYLYRALNNSGHYVCTGQIFSTYAANGYNVSNYGAFIYDATVSLIRGIVAYNELLNDGQRLPTHISGLALKEVLVGQNISFKGVSGRVAFSGGIPQIANYGVGDRVVGVRYMVTNFNSQNDTLAGFHLNRIGTWRSEGGYKSCLDDPSMQSYLTGGCSEISWGSKGSKPNDRADPTTLSMAPSMVQALWAMATISLAGSLFVAGCLVYYRNNQLLKASQSQMMWLIVISNFYGCGRIVVSALQINTYTCVASFWLGHMAVSGIFALFAKTLRVTLIVSSNMRKFKVTAFEAMLLTACLFSFLLVFMLVFSLVNPNFAGVIVEEAITGQTVYTPMCTSGNIGFEMALYAYEAFILLLCTKLCYDCRGVPDVLNESPHIASVITSIVSVCTIAFPLVYALDLGPFVNQMIIGTGFFICTMSFLLSYFGPKLYHLLSGAEIDKRTLTIVKRRRRTTRPGWMDSKYNISTLIKTLRLRDDKTVTRKQHTQATNKGSGDIERGGSGSVSGTNNKGGGIRRSDSLGGNNSGDEGKDPRDGSRHSSSSRFQTDNMLSRLPRNIEECEQIVDHLRALLIILTMRATMDSSTPNNSKGPSSGVGGAATGQRNQQQSSLQPVPSQF